MEFPNGVHKDDRPEEKKSLDFPHIVGAVQLNWPILDINNLGLPSLRRQNGSSSCVFQACATALEILTGKIVSASPYFWRKNYPNAGSYLYDAMDIMYNRYTDLESVSPSQNQTEIQMNTIKPLTTTIGCIGYRTLVTKTFEQVCEAVEQYKQCVMTFESNGQEWTHNPLATPIYDGSAVAWGHGIVAVKYGILNINGVMTRVLVCRCSATPSGIVFITEDFFNHRCTDAKYFLGAKDVSVPQDIVVPPVPVIQDNPTEAQKEVWYVSVYKWLLNASSILNSLKE